MNDKIADMINRIKTAGDAGKKNVVVAYTKMSEAVLTVLKAKGFISNFSKKGKDAKAELVIDVAYFDARTPRVSGFNRISKLSRRMYTPTKDIPTVKNGMGIVVLSTPKGVLAGDEARKEKVGGEILFKIW